MKFKIIIAFILTAVLTNTFAQIKFKVDNELLEQVINLEDFERQFYICKNGFDTIIVIDSSYSFNSFTSTRSCPKKIVVERNNNYHPNKSTGKEAKNIIAIYNLNFKKRFLLIDLWQPYSGGTLRLRVIKRQSKYFIKVVGIGAF